VLLANLEVQKQPVQYRVLGTEKRSKCKLLTSAN